MILDSEKANYETFRDCLGDAMIQDLTASAEKPKGKKSRAGKARRRSVASKDDARAGKQESIRAEDVESTDAEDLGDFIEYLASEIFPTLPQDLKTLSYSALQNDTSLTAKYPTPLAPSTTEHLANLLPPPVTDSISTYLNQSTHALLTKTLDAFITSTTAPPPIYSTTKTPHCELCFRSWIPLTYHHLIPRSVHAKALKRGWHDEWELNKVAWLCRACHSFVHRCASNEELAREWDSVEKLMGREDVRGFVEWVGRVRWKSR